MHFIINYYFLLSRVQKWQKLLLKFIFLYKVLPFLSKIVIFSFCLNDNKKLNENHKSEDGW